MNTTLHADKHQPTKPSSVNHPVSLLHSSQGQLSRQQHIVEVTQPFILPDGSASFKDYSTSRNNRYTHDSAAKNRVYPPSRMLHFWNSPPGISPAQLQDVFAHAGVPVPTYVTLISLTLSSFHTLF